MKILHIDKDTDFIAFATANKLVGTNATFDYITNKSLDNFLGLASPTAPDGGAKPEPKPKDTATPTPQPAKAPTTRAQPSSPTKPSKPSPHPKTTGTPATPAPAKPHS
jgi:hypothetical protein